MISDLKGLGLAAQGLLGFVRDIYTSYYEIILKEVFSMLILLSGVVGYYVFGLLTHVIFCSVCIVETIKNGVPFKEACKMLLPNDWPNVKSILIDAWSWPIIILNLVIWGGWAYVRSMIKENVENYNKD